MSAELAPRHHTSSATPQRGRYLTRGDTRDRRQFAHHSAVQCSDANWRRNLLRAPRNVRWTPMHGDQCDGQPPGTGILYCLRQCGDEMSTACNSVFYDKVDDFCTNRKRVCDFLLVRHRNLGYNHAPFLRCGNLLAENGKFYLPLSHSAPLLCMLSSQFRCEVNHEETPVMELSCSEDRMIFTTLWQTNSQTARQTVWRTDFIIVKRCAMLTRCKNLYSSSAAARLTTGARKYDHVMPLLKDLHWLRVPERITYKLCVLVHSCLHGTAPRYLQDVIQPVAVTSRRRLRSASSCALVVPVTRRTTIGDRAFAVAGPRAWNSLPQFVTDCPSPGTFRQYLKTYLFSLSF